MLIKHAFRIAVALLFLWATSSIAEQAPGFKLPTVKSSVALSAYKGRVVYVDFWASWCGPCRKSFPWMGDLQQRYKSSVKVIAINLDQERSDAIAFLKQHRPGFTVAFDPDGKVAESYKVPAMPTSYLIDQSGKIVSRYVGFRSKEKQSIEKKIQALVSNKHARVGKQ